MLSWSTVSHTGRRLRANLGPRSVHLHDALRMGAALGLAIGAARVFNLQHGFWVALAALTIVRSNLAATGRRVGQALAGTAMGFVVAFLVIDAAGRHTAVYAVLAPLTIFAAIFANVAIGFMAGQAAFTVAVLVLFSLLAPAGWQIGLVRVEDVAAGALIGLTVGAAAWPRGAASAVGPAIAGLLRASAAYLAVAVEAIITSSVEHLTAGAVARRRSAATRAASVADSAFALYLADRPAPSALECRSAALSTANRMWYAADTIHAIKPDRTALSSAEDLKAIVTVLQDAAENSADRLCQRAGDAVSVSDPRPDPQYRADTLFDWLADIVAEVKRVGL
jgi:uncharacterized membrane protein YccC